MNKIKISKIMIITTACLLMLAGQALAALEWTLDQTIPLTTGARDVAESPDGKRLYVLTGEGTILVLDPSGRVETTIPGLTDHEIPAIVDAATRAGAQWVAHVVLRLPHGLGPLFEAWLQRHFPDVESMLGSGILLSAIIAMVVKGYLTRNYHENEN